MSVTSADVAVSLEHVRRTYGGDQPVVALDDVDVRFARGTATAVMGPSGSGKSTLLHCAAGLDRPDAGTVRIGSTDLASLSEKRLTELRRSRVGFVFQAFNLVGALNVEQNILLPSRLSGQRPDPAWVAEVVDRVGLGNRLRHRPAQLSGGQQQRAAIARALVTRPEVIFCDEPTGALDTRTAADVLSLLRSVVDQAGQTVVMVTHDPVAASYADRVVVLADGRIVRDMPQPGAERIAEHLAHLGGRESDARPVAQSVGRTAAQTFAGPAAQSLARATARPAVRGEG
ncbi:ABC transporter ATP-binding protein [Streptomyces prasinopilosus]|uniref:Putative ABC transport system ATP-binding protein n=1 Tax=Streptomyces prasinopilosus TaxID=67344 RepID=A0A1G6JIP6_9ACTN|nr:ABC transporter ATP-binding protein [Streptomyces prasinopilosus]SDC18561.1 putative ABC transport system ATP-binding protein [Streptomyces prasinopilosus]